MMRLINIWADWMWACTWQVLILIAVVWTIDRLGRKRLWPHIFLCLWAMVLLKLLLPPFLGSPISITRPLLGANGAPLFVDDAIRDSSVYALAVANITWLKPTLFAVWCFGVFGLAAFYSIRYLRMRRHIASCALPPESVQRLAEDIADGMEIGAAWQLRVCGELQMPGMFGVWRPTILLPRDVVTSEGDAHLKSILAHEFAHIRRGDAAFRLLTHAILIWYWFNPALIVLRRRLAQLQEICCDATALSYLRQDRSSYINTLVHMGRRLLQTDDRLASSPTLLSVFDTSGGLSERMQRLLNQPRRLTSRQRKIIGVLVLLAFKVTIFPMGDPDVLTHLWFSGGP